jgi:hypothetical protein
MPQAIGQRCQRHDFGAFKYPTSREDIGEAQCSQACWRQDASHFVLHAIQCVNLAQVKLWYAEPYEFRLGRFLTISTTHLSSTPSVGNGTHQSTTAVSILTSIFPERDIGCKIEEASETFCRTSPSYPGGHALMGLMTLEAFMGNGGDEVPDVKILVCSMNVKPPRTCTLRTPRGCTFV